tara:strand:+ start:814 stop:1542 length:729 start_codon:yes stop_codon:yes gene_type:complete
MAVSVDTVYQRVLAIANKEQRGYITPQEYNLLANQAQMSIFEQYFYDINQFGRQHGNDTEYSDMLDVLNKKLAPFQKTSDALTYNAIPLTFTLPNDMYRLGTVIYKPATFDYSVEVTEIKENELLHINSSPIARPIAKRPIYTRFSENSIKIHPQTIISDVNCTYVTAPKREFGTDAVWGYAVVNGQALFNASQARDFMLHDSEESNLVIRILELAGIVLNKPGLVQIAAGEDREETQQQKQ